MDVYKVDSMLEATRQECHRPVPKRESKESKIYIGVGKGSTVFGKAGL